MIIAYGGGSAVGNPPITAGPYGREVWDDDVAGKHPSKANAVYALPEPFNQVGNKFVQKSEDAFVERFQKIMNDAMNNLPKDFFADCLIEE